AAQHQARARERRPATSDPARVVPRRAVRLVAAIVLLVDDDQTELVQRREDRGPRPEHDTHLAAQDPPPRVMTLAGAERRVQHRKAFAKDPRQAVAELRDQRYLGHQHDDAAALLDDLRDGREVDVGLPRRRYPLQQELPARWELVERFERAPLLPGQLGLQPGG